MDFFLSAVLHDRRVRFHTALIPRLTNAEKEAGECSPRYSSSGFAFRPRQFQVTVFSIAYSGFYYIDVSVLVVKFIRNYIQYQNLETG